jgi:hypothetical protein
VVYAKPVRYVVRTVPWTAGTFTAQMSKYSSWHRQFDKLKPATHCYDKRVGWGRMR